MNTVNSLLQMLEAFANPPKLEDAIRSAVQNDTEFVSILKAIISEYDHQINDKED